ncbi:MAG: glycosyltransferase [Deltaproteobacteria bacterium]|nr:glycosyltransferase [Deltaproteobacteria bacterium]
MKIVYVRSYFSSFLTLYDYLEDAFRRAGHEFYPFDYRSFLIPARIRQHSGFLNNIAISKLNREFVRLVDNVKPDLLFLMHGFTIQPSIIVELKKKHHLITVNWLCDYPKDYELACKYASNFDYFFVSGTDAMKRLRLAGHKNVHPLLFACEPLYHKPVELTHEDKRRYSSDICFIGSMYPGRLRMLEKVSDFDIAIWGPGWDKIPIGSALTALIRGGSLDVGEWVKVYSATKIVLNNISSFASYVDNMMNTRLFEILACQAFQLVDTRDDVLMHFTSGSELVCYSSIEELRHLFNYYLSHRDEAKEIAMNGYNKAIKFHTYDHRVKEIMDVIKG